MSERDGFEEERELMQRAEHKIVKGLSEAVAHAEITRLRARVAELERALQKISRDGDIVAYQIARAVLAQAPDNAKEDRCPEGDDTPCNRKDCNREQECQALAQGSPTQSSVEASLSDDLDNMAREFVSGAFGPFGLSSVRLGDYEKIIRELLNQAVVTTRRRALGASEPR